MRLTDEQREALPNMIKGIEEGIWHPTPATKRLLADVFRRALWLDNRGHCPTCRCICECGYVVNSEGCLAAHLDGEGS